MLELNIYRMWAIVCNCAFFPVLDNLDMSFSLHCDWSEYELRVLSIGRIPE